MVTIEKAMKNTSSSVNRTIRWPEEINAMVESLAVELGYYPLKNGGVSKYLADLVQREKDKRAAQAKEDIENARKEVRKGTKKTRG